MQVSLFGPGFCSHEAPYAKLSTPKQHWILTHFRTISLAARGMIQSALQDMEREINQAMSYQVIEEEIEHLRQDLTYPRIHFQGEQHPEITLPGRSPNGPSRRQAYIIGVRTCQTQEATGHVYFP